MRKAMIAMLLFSATAVQGQDSLVFNPGGHIKTGFFTNLFFGKAYRDVWKTDVKAPVLDIESMKLTPDKVGGRLETQSLRFKDEKGRSWVGRSVQKDLSKMLPERKRNGFMGKMLRDHASANEPYAALVVAELASRLKILHATPKLYVLPDDTTLGKFAAYKRMPVLFEERPADSWNGDPVFGSPADISDTEKLMKMRFEKGNITFDREMYLKGRLLDILVGDWSRHDEQYRWSYIPIDSGYHVMPIPKDRDHALFKKEGLLNKMSQVVWPYPTNFTHSIRRLHRLNHMAKNTDKLILPEISRAEWMKVTNEFLASIDTSAIDAALAKLPRETFVIDGNELRSKLLSRLKEMPVASLEFYRSVNEKPFIPASDKKDKVMIALMGDSVKVSVALKEEQKPYFERTFHSGETQDLTIAALDGSDEIVVTGKGTSIRLNIHQGPADDEIEAESLADSKSVRFYDTKPRKIYDYLTAGTKEVSRRKRNPLDKKE